MLNTFDSLAEFENIEKENSEKTISENNATVDVSAIINRLNDMETKINKLLNERENFPTSGKADNIEVETKNESEVTENESDTSI